MTLAPAAVGQPSHETSCRIAARGPSLTASRDTSRGIPAIREREDQPEAGGGLGWLAADRFDDRMGRESAQR